MDILFDIALFAHLLSLFGVGAIVIAVPAVTERIPAAAPEVRGMLGGIAEQIGVLSRLAFLVLLVSGPLMVWLRFGGLQGMSVWFWVKMALIVVVIFCMVANGYYRGRAQKGDSGAARLAGLAANLSRLALVGIVGAAVLAFN